MECRLYDTGTVPLHLGAARFFVFLVRTRVYTQMQPWLDSVRRVFGAVIYGAVSCIVLLFLFKESIVLSRIYAVLFFIFVICSIFIVRYLVHGS